MNEAPRPQSPEMEGVKHEIREEHGEAADATSATAQDEEQVSPEDFENDPAHIPTTRR